MRFLARRLGFYMIALWASVTLNFFLPRLMPGDPASAMFARLQGQMKPEQIEAMRKAYGLSDAPLWRQYLDYLNSLFHLDFGTSIAYFPSPVMDVIKQSVQWTILLGFVALGLSFTIGSLLGVLGAWKRGGKLDSILPPTLLFTGSFPYFWLATLALFFLGFTWGLLPLRHAYEDGMHETLTWPFIQSVGLHLIMPAGTIVLVSLGGWMLSMRNAMISTLSEDYVTMAEAKGLSQKDVMLRYAARNAMLPSVTAFGMAVGFVISGALVTETVFAYPGLGFNLLTAVRSLDYPLMQGIFLMITLAVLFVNFIVDILYVRLDPRVRTS